MNTEAMSRILEKIEEYSRIIIFRHVRPDCDAVGSSKGLRDILRLSYPQKEIFVINTDRSEKTAFLGEEDQQLDDLLYRDALGIAVDSATPDRIANPKYRLCRELIKIDHHINVSPYGDIEWVEHERSSASEMIAELCLAFPEKLKINVQAATYLYAGIVADSGRFRFSSVSGDTLRCAAFLLDLGIDTERIFTNLYLDDYSSLKFRAHICKKMKRTESGVLYITVDRSVQNKFGITVEQAGEAVNYMDSIKGSLIWIVFVEAGGKLRVRLRSRFVEINKLAEKYGGGGHACACGATVTDKKEALALIRDAEELLKNYKSNNDGWL